MRLWGAIVCILLPLAVFLAQNASLGGAAQRLVSTGAPTPTLEAATVTPTPVTPTPGPTTEGKVLADDTFTGPSTIMPLAPGTLFLDSAGYEMIDAASNPKTVSATPLHLPALDHFSAAATLTLVSGDASAGYGFRLGSDAASVFVDLNQQGQYRVQRVQDNTRTTLVEWAAQTAIHQGLAMNRLRLDYAAGLLQISVNEVLVGFVELPSATGATTVGLIDDGGKTTTQVRCTHFTVWDGPVVALDDHFGSNSAGWNLGPSFTIGNGMLVMNPPPKNADVTTYPERVPPSNNCTALATITKVSGPDDQWLGGLVFLSANGIEYTFEIYGNGRFGIDYWQQSWHTLLLQSTPVLRTGNTSNTLFLRYNAGILTAGANGATLATLSLSATPAVGQVGLRTEGRSDLSFNHVLLLQPPSLRTAALTPAPALRVDHVLLRTSFASDTKEWNLYPPTVVIQDHALHITVHDADTTSWTNTKSLQLGAAYSVSAVMRLSAAAHSDSPYGLLFQVDPSVKSGEFLAFGITPDGNYDVSWLHRGVWQRDLIPYTVSPLVMPGMAANRLRVDMLGATAQMYLNGNYLATVRLPSETIPGGTQLSLGGTHLTDVRLPTGARDHQVGVMTTTGNDLEVESAQVTNLIMSTTPPFIKPIQRPTPLPQPPGPILSNPQQVAKDRVAPAVVQIVVSTLFAHNRPAYGTGLIVLSDHTGIYVLTAHHVVNQVFPGDAQRIHVRLPNGQTLRASGLEILPVQRGHGVTTNADLALIRLPAQSDVHTAAFGDSGAVDSPESVLAVGYPIIAGYSSNQPFVQAGALQNTREHVDGLPGLYLAHSAAVAEGMSGGPLVMAQSLVAHGQNLLGKVIGINLEYARPLNTGPQAITTNPALNLNLALPSRAVLPVLATLLHTLHPGPYTLP